MPTVDIKGVGKAQFPDGMSADDIRSFLRSKYLQQAVNGQSDMLSPRADTITPYEPTLTERMGQGVSNALFDSGLVSGRYGAQRVGETISSIGEFLPGVGDATAGDEFGTAAAKGDYSGMALAGLGVIPVAGDLAKKTFKGANPVNIHDTIRNRFKRPEKTVNLPQGSAGSSEFEKIKEIDPKAKVIGRQQDGTISVSYLDEYQPKQVNENNPNLFDFDPDALEITENETKRIDNYKGRADKPVVVTKKDGDYFILDGHHRTKIAKESGKSVRAVVIPFKDVDAMKKDGIHQGDMFEEWVATGQNNKQQSLPMVNKIDEYKGAYPLDDFDNWWGDRTYKEQGADMFEMSPDDYLSQVKPLKMDEETLENVDDLVDHMESGRKLDPLVIYADGKEDGRHRALAAKKLGFDTVPVIDYRSQ